MRFDPTTTVPGFLDLATSTGWAIRLLGGRRIWGSFSLDDWTELGPKLHRLDIEVKKLTADHGVNLWVYEKAFILPARWSEKRQRMTSGTHQETAALLFAMGGHIAFMGSRDRSPVRWELRTDILKFFLGTYPNSREEQKLAVMKMCKLRGWTPANDDEGDALAGLDLVCHRIKIKDRNSGPLFLHNREVTVT